MGVVYYANPDPTFQPSMRLVNDITNAYPASVTTSFAHDFITGTIVRILIPYGFGMKQIDKQHGTITVTGDTTFTIDIDTRLYDPFSISLPLATDYAKIPIVIAIAEANSTLLAAVRNVLP